eukprot:gene3495-3994_t
MFTIVLGVSALVIVGLLYIVLFPSKKFIPTPVDDEPEDEVPLLNANNRGGRGGLAHTGIDPRTGKKMGTKKIEKLKKKEERRKQREIEEETRIRLEKEKKEDEEYQAMKGAISLDESGESKHNEEQERNLLQEFIRFLENNKICLLEDISMEFGMKTNEVIDRIKTLDKEGFISGVIDDRGKFIYVTRQEMESVAKFIARKGRVTIDQIAKESNKLIDLTPKADVAVTDIPADPVESTPVAAN